MSHTSWTIIKSCLLVLLLTSFFIRNTSAYEVAINGDNYSFIGVGVADVHISDSSTLLIKTDAVTESSGNYFQIVGDLNDPAIKMMYTTALAAQISGKNVKRWF